MSLDSIITFDKPNNIHIVEPSGELDAYTAPKFRQTLNDIFPSEDDITDLKIDMSNLDYIDSTGLGVLIGTLKRLKQKNKDLYITNLKDNVKKIFLITGLDKIFKMEG